MNPATQPQYLMVVGQQPLSAPGGTPGPGPQQQPPAQSMEGQQIPQMMDPAQQVDPMSLVQPQSMPQPAQAPAINGVPQPTTPEQAMMQSMGGQPVGS